MKIGLQIPIFNWPGSPQNLGAQLAAIARTADEVGFASIWVMDHYFQIERTVLAPFYVGAGSVTASALLENCRALAGIGIQHVIFSAVPNVHELTPLELIGREVIPAVAEW